MTAAAEARKGLGWLLGLGRDHRLRLKRTCGGASRALSSSNMKPYQSVAPGSRRRCSSESEAVFEDSEADGMEGVLRIVKKACDALSPLVRCIYYAQTSETSMQKADKSMFTIADGLVQELVIRHLFSRVKMQAIVAEEDVHCKIDSRPYRIGDYQVPLNSEITVNIENARESLNAYARELERLDAKNHIFNKLSLFLDPIDGTKEFVHKKGHCCTICIGFAKDRRAEAGIVYRPISTPNTWAAGCKNEQYFDNNLSEYPDDDRDVPTLLTPSTSSPFLLQLREELNAEQLAIGGCGNKALTLLEQPNTWYVLDRGLSRWDTCAAQAVIEAHGGEMMKLTAFCDEDASETKNYAYAETSVNLDWNPKAKLTPYNAKKKEVVEDVVEDGDVLGLDEVLPYANICGVVAFPKTSMKQLQAIEAATKSAAFKFEPYFT